MPRTRDSWSHRVARVNRAFLVGDPAQALKSLTFEARNSWQGGLCAYAASLLWRRYGRTEDLDACTRYLDSQVSPNGEWNYPPRLAADATKALPLIILFDRDPRYALAAQAMARFLVDEYPYGVDRCLPYHPESGLMLVDTLAMVSPFLIQFGKKNSLGGATQLGLIQLTCFCERAIDPQTHLPYHAYDPEGPDRLGPQGWGRGTGWLLMGLVDSLMALKASERPAILLSRLQLLSRSLSRFQSPCGHWRWCIPQRNEATDSSATALIAYALARAISAGLLEESDVQPSLTLAAEALKRDTGIDGRVSGGSGECFGVSLYSREFGNNAWTQAATAMFISTL